MPGLTVTGLCICEVGHSIPVPDQSELWTQEDAERVVCSFCKTTVENLKLIEPDSHAGMKAPVHSASKGAQQAGTNP